MERSEYLFWRWIDLKCESIWNEKEGIGYEHRQSDYISPIIQVNLIIDENNITCKACVPVSEEDYCDKYPELNEWIVSWNDLNNKGFSYFLQLLQQNSRLEHLQGKTPVESAESDLIERDKQKD